MDTPDPNGKKALGTSLSPRSALPFLNSAVKRSATHSPGLLYSAASQWLTEPRQTITSSFLTSVPGDPTGKGMTVSFTTRRMEKDDEVTRSVS